ncbi:MAG: hypothetical protein HC915_11970 [Anaerolineae bacterium]|nr:hypothetical protein [Anaerolineae bacterium]
MSSFQAICDLKQVHRRKQPMLKLVIIYTDGACGGNPGPGGWAAILPYNGHMKAIKGGRLQNHQQ